MVLISFLCGAVIAAMLWVLLAPAFTASVFTRQNFRDRDLPTAVGVLLPLVSVAVNAALEVAVAAGMEPDDLLVAGLRLSLGLGFGFAMLGLLDDLGGTGESGGFAGHLRALGQGRLTTGAVKLFGGAGLAVAVVAQARPPGDGGADVARLLLDGALVALAANLANLLDRAPGRVVKLSLLSLLVLVVAAGAEPELGGVAVIVGAGAGLLIPDLREQMMLGDAGANVLGAALGLGVVLACSPGVRTGVLVAVLALNLISERVSFSRVIDAVAPLRAADRFGRMP